MSRAPKVAAAIAETTHKAELELGPGVVNGVLLWTSASGLTKIDRESTGGCERRWWFEQVLGLRQPSTAAQERGTKLHAEVEGYLTTGATLITPLAIAGRHFIPEPGPGILIEAPLARKNPDGTLATYLWSHGVAIAGHVDLWNHRGQYIDAEGDVRREPRPNTLETKDWKTTSDFQYAKTSAELARNIQLVTYAESGFRAWPHLEHGRMTHVYFRTRGAPQSKLSTVLCDREQIARRWEYAEGLVRLARDVARETDQDKVPANRNACGAYGGCPHQKRCHVGSHDSLAEIFGPRGAENLSARMRGEPVHQEQNVSLIDKLNPDAVAAAQAQMSAAAAAPTQIAPGVQTLPPAQGVGVSISMAPAIDAEMAALRAAEAQRQAQAAAGIPVGFQEALASLDRSGYGAPTFVGRAAQAVAYYRGQQIAPGQGLQGTGWLGDNVKNPVEDPALVLQLAGEVAGLPPLQAPPPAALVTPAPAPAPVVQAPPPVMAPPPIQAPPPPVQMAPAAPPTTISVLPPDAPASNPMIAAAPVEGFNNAKTAEIAALQAQTQLVAVPGLAQTAAVVAATGQLPAPPSMLQAQAPANVPAPTMTAPPPAAPVNTTPASTPAQTASSTPAPAAKTRKPRKSKATGEGIRLYVNAVPRHEFDRLEPYVARLCATLCAEYGASDIQCAPKDGPLGYNKWPGAVRALARKEPPPAGDYVIKTNGNDPAAFVVEALALLIEETGLGEVVEGVTW